MRRGNFFSRTSLLSLASSQRLNGKTQTLSTRSYRHSAAGIDERGGARFPRVELGEVRRRGSSRLRDEDPEERREDRVSSVDSYPISRSRSGGRCRGGGDGRGRGDACVRAEPVAVGRDVLHSAGAVGGAPALRGQIRSVASFVRPRLCEIRLNGVGLRISVVRWSSGCLFLLPPALGKGNGELLFSRRAAA